MIKPLRDTYLISADETANEKTASGLYIDPTWDKYKNAVQVGVIESLPLSISKSYNNDVEIDIGDKVYFHHFVIQDDNYLMDGDKKLFKLPRYHLYCVVKDGKIIVVDDWILVSPILETEEDITKQYGTLKLYTKAVPDKKMFMATVEHISTQGVREGFKIGDTIVYRTDADYEIKIEGKEYYRMKTKNVVATFRDGKLLPLRDELMIENTARKEQVTKSGIILPAIKKERQQREKVVNIGSQYDEEQYNIGDEVSIFWYMGSGINHEGKNYVFLRPDEIIGKYLN